MEQSRDAMVTGDTSPEEEDANTTDERVDVPRPRPAIAGRREEVWGTFICMCVCVSE